MPTLNLEEQQALQQELTPGESVLWSGKPDPRIIFHTTDWYMIPFSLLWGGFAIFWEAGVTGFLSVSHGRSAPSFFMLWGIPFVLIGQYFIWGRFLYAAWKKKRILYAVTDRRVLVLASPPRGKVISSFLDTIPTISKQVSSNGAGTLTFGNPPPVWNSGRSGGASFDGLYLNSGIPVFVDIDDVDAVYSIVANRRNPHRTQN